MKTRPVLDVSALPLHGHQSQSVTWWGTLGFMLIEGTGFALTIAIYIYLQSIASEWPLSVPPPNLIPGTATTVVLLVSAWPNVMIGRWAQQYDLRKVRLGLLVMTAFGIVPLIIRWFEFKALNVRWDSNAYGSVVWLLLGLHTTHFVTDLGDTLILAALMFVRKQPNKRRFGDVQDNALYWHFVVVTWLPIYFVIYILPRL